MTWIKFSPNSTRICQNHSSFLGSSERAFATTASADETYEEYLESEVETSTGMKTRFLTLQYKFIAKMCIITLRFLHAILCSSAK